MTRFLCQELLFEYDANRLAPGRRHDIEVHLSGDRESQRELENLRKGARYAQSLAQLQLTSALAESLRAFEPRWKIKLQTWTLWSSRRGWRALPYMVLAAAILLTAITLRPWSPSPTQTLAEQIPTPPHLPDPGAPASLAADVLNPKAPLVLDTRPSLLEKPIEREVASEKTEATPAAAPTAAPTPPPSPGRAELWRGTLSVAHFSRNAPAVRAKLIELQAKAAGAVELGWLRQPHEAYFHASLPESNFAALKAYLTTLGPVRIARERHQRVMPAGQIRIILTVKDNGKDDSATEPEAEGP